MTVFCFFTYPNVHITLTSERLSCRVVSCRVKLNDQPIYLVHDVIQIKCCSLSDKQSHTHTHTLCGLHVLYPQSTSNIDISIYTQNGPISVYTHFHLTHQFRSNFVTISFPNKMMCNIDILSIKRKLLTKETNRSLIF